LGQVHTAVKDYDKALELHNEALKIFEKCFGNDHEKVAWTLNYIAEVYRKQGRYGWDGMIELYQLSIDCLSPHFFLFL
jgi:tetratricopeptide (TPR) repeat protein